MLTSTHKTLISLAGVGLLVATACGGDSESGDDSPGRAGSAGETGATGGSGGSDSSGGSGGSDIFMLHQS